MESEVKATILSLVSIAISLIAFYFEEYRIIIISIYALFLVGYILFAYINRLEKIEEKIKELEKSFKRAEDLIEIRANIENIKRGIIDG